MKQTNDQEILQLIRDPSTKELGFRILIEQYQRRVYQVVRRMVLIHEDADDLTQNTFIKAYRHLDKFQENAGLFTWLYRIAVNETLTFLEKKKKRFFFSIEDHQDRLESYIDRPDSLNGNEIEKKLAKALLQLPEKQRLVFNLKYQEDMTYEQIAQITDTSIGALKASYHHAVKKIEEFLNQE
ncbi:sigma-70 family RNA polymerase sigma factor [Algoriphagus kandeliae]|uniref:RNA polymerase sigma factor n=1 Tax=Algoriphagus kandeliae TaxID=2562278 RepID=A0A4Y9R2Q2_9BACT|nr:sigma-70 family RNA polymerase sigma factor [Algoriphagus kandeliae]TFV97575.1 sigma-70 family RNA polymerase sigma factor [Algoriphagus kandeliae]